MHNNYSNIPNYRMIGKKRKCIAPTDEVDLETLRQLKGLDKPQKEVDEEDLYSQSVAATLRNMTSEQRAMAKIKIQQILYEIQYCMPQAPFPANGSY